MCCFYLLMNKELLLAYSKGRTELGGEDRTECWEEEGRVRETPWSRRRQMLEILQLATATW